MRPGNLVCLLVCIFSINGEARSSQITQTAGRTFTISGRPAIILRNTSGWTRVTAGSQPRVQVHAIKEVHRVADEDEARRVAQGVEVRIEQRGNRVEIEAKYPKKSESFSDSGPQVFVHFEVTAPKGSDIDARSTDGSLDVDGFDGRLDLGTGGGDLTAIHCSGRIDAHTRDGSLKIDDASGAVSVRTAEGRIALDGILQALDIRAGNGRVNVTVRPGSRMESVWSIRTGDGDVRLYLPAGFSADLDATTKDGQIESNLPVTPGKSASEQHLVGKLYGGGGLLRIQTGGGDIAVLKS